MLPYPTFEGYSRKLMTLTMIIRNDEILLGMKNRGMGKGKWNGFGGKVEPNETINDAAKREVKEECGLDVISMVKVGIIEFEYVGSTELLEGHIYLCNMFGGDIIESDEMAPIKWFKIEDAPCDTMWIDHKFWFPMILKQIPFKAHFKYQNDDTLLEKTIILLNNEEKIRETFVNVVVKKDHYMLLYKNIKESKYLNMHEQVKKGESIEIAALRYLKKYYGVASEQIQKIGVVNMEFIDKPHQEINFFVVDVSKLTKSQQQVEDDQWLDVNSIPAKENLKPILLRLFTMKPFEAYYLFDDSSNILCNVLNT